MRKGEPSQSAKDGIRETEAQKEEQVCGCLSSLCPPGREEGEERVVCAQMLPGPVPAIWGHFLSILQPAAPAVAKLRLWTQEDVSLELSSGIS